jgi:uncharacterized iron-regulated protein
MIRRDRLLPIAVLLAIGAFATPDARAADKVDTIAVLVTYADIAHAAYQDALTTDQPLSLVERQAFEELIENDHGLRVVSTEKRGARRRQG